MATVNTTNSLQWTPPNVYSGCSGPKTQNQNIWVKRKDTFFMNATEKVSQDTIPWSINSTNAVSVNDNISPKLERERNPKELEITSLETMKSSGNLWVKGITKQRDARGRSGTEQKLCSKDTAKGILTRIPKGPVTWKKIFVVEEYIF